MIATETHLWPHQITGIESVQDAHAEGLKKIVMTSPCGGGKTVIMSELIEWAGMERMPVALYTSRKLLCAQTARVLEDRGIQFGMRASGHEPALLRDVQIAMTPTELVAVYKKEKRTLHRAALVLIDEIHMQGGAAMERIIADHVEVGALVVAFTATPLDLLGEWERLRRLTASF